MNLLTKSWGVLLNRVNWPSDNLTFSSLDPDHTILGTYILVHVRTLYPRFCVELYQPRHDGQTIGRSEREPSSTKCT